MRRIADADLRYLLLNCCDDNSAPALGQVRHLALYEAMATACGSVDGQLAHDLLSSFSIVGPIARSVDGLCMTSFSPNIPVEDALARAWDMRRKLKIWDLKIEDCHEGSCKGPWFSESEISSVLGCEAWIPAQRFEVVQKNKVQGSAGM